MKKITLTVDIEGNDVTRHYTWNPDISAESWGTRVLDMLDTLSKANDL